MTKTRKPRPGPDPADEEDYFAAALADDPPAPAASPGGWPAEVPVLTADDLVWQFSDARGRHDLAAWLELTFNPGYPFADSTRHAKARRVLCGVLGERLGRRVPCLWRFLEEVHARELPPKAWQAACWNEMLVRLGYEVPAAAARDPGRRKEANGED